MYFDTAKAEIKPTSEETLTEIGKLMKENAQLEVLVVGHTGAWSWWRTEPRLSQDS